MTQLIPFQKEGVRQIYRFAGRALLADQMGLGKTLQALYWLLKIPSRRPAVIVCPASMKYTWQAEAQLHFNLHTEVLEGCNPTTTELPGEIVILNYNILSYWLPVLLKARPRAVIFDEVHFIKSPTAKRTKHSIQLADSADSVVGLSGTPLTNRPIELWTVLRAICPTLFPSREKYAWEYCAPRYTIWGWRFDGATNLPKLNRVLRENCMIRRLKKDVLQELPAKQSRYVCFRLKSYREYDEAQNNFIAWLQKQDPKKAKRAQKAEAISKIGYLMRLCARLKLQWTEQWIRDFFEAHPGKKLVAFTMHTFVIDYLKERFSQRCVVIDGRVPSRERQDAVRQFRSHARKDLFLGNWQAAGVGITLVSAHNIAALDFPWTPGDLLQGGDRCHRIGQRNEVIMHYLALLGTVEEKQINLLRKKTKVLDAVLDGARDSQDLDIFNELLKEFQNENRQ